MIVVDANDKEIAAIALLSYHYDFKNHIFVNETTIRLWQLSLYWRLQSHPIGIPNVHYELTSRNFN